MKNNMKKLHSFSATLLSVAVLAAGCSNEDNLLPNSGIAASEQTLIASTGTDTRTQVTGTDYQVVWSASDAFFAFGDQVEGANAYKAYGTFTLKEGADNGVGTTDGKFNGKLTGELADLKYAVYPASNFDRTTKALTFPDTYSYPNSNAPMFGTVVDGENNSRKVNFSNLLSGMMRITLNGLPTGNGTVVLSATNGTLAGTAILTIGDDGTPSLGTLTAATGGGNTITLTFNNDTEGGNLVLDIPLPAGNYTQGITAALQVGESNQAEVFKTTENFTVTAGLIKRMPAISNIEIDANTNDLKFTEEVESMDALKTAMSKSGSYTLTKDITANEQLEVPTGTNLVLDLGGKTISNTTGIWNNNTHAWSNISVAGGTLTLKNGKIQAQNEDCFAVDVRDGGTLIIESGEYVGNITSIYAYEGTVKIEGGTFSIQQLSSEETDPYKFLLNCYDKNRKANKANITVTGGTFINFNPADCAAEGAGTNFVAEGYKSVKVENYQGAPQGATVYQVVKDDETQE